MKTQLMSMEDLAQVCKDKTCNMFAREACARELAKRENNLYKFYKYSRPIRAEDYLQ